MDCLGILGLAVKTRVVVAVAEKLFVDQRTADRDR